MNLTVYPGLWNMKESRCPSLAICLLYHAFRWIFSGRLKQHYPLPMNLTRRYWNLLLPMNLLVIVILIVLLEGCSFNQLFQSAIVLLFIMQGKLLFFQLSHVYHCLWPSGLEKHTTYGQWDTCSSFGRFNWIYIKTASLVKFYVYLINFIWLVECHCCYML